MEVVMGVNPMEGNKIIEKFLALLLGVLILCQRREIMQKGMVQVDIFDAFMVGFARHSMENYRLLLVHIWGVTSTSSSHNGVYTEP